MTAWQMYHLLKGAGYGLIIIPANLKETAWRADTKGKAALPLPAQGLFMITMGEMTDSHTLMR